jgi:hypothetical protein
LAAAVLDLGLDPIGEFEPGQNTEERQGAEDRRNDFVAALEVAIKRRRDDNKPGEAKTGEQERAETCFYL